MKQQKERAYVNIFEVSMWKRFDDWIMVCFYLCQCIYIEWKEGVNKKTHIQPGDKTAE